MVYQKFLTQIKIQLNKPINLLKIMRLNVNNSGHRKSTLGKFKNQF